MRRIPPRLIFSFKANRSKVFAERIAWLLHCMTGEVTRTVKCNSRYTVQRWSGSRWVDG
jgi:hypothetical protein